MNLPEVLMLGPTANGVRHAVSNTHFWHWVSANAGALQATISIVAALLTLITIGVLIWTGIAVKAQAEAARALTVVAKKQAKAAMKQSMVAEQQKLVSERAALASEKQVEAAIASSAVAEAQRKATEDAAHAERIHSELIRLQTLAALRPVLVFAFRADANTFLPFIENHGEGIALNIVVKLNRTEHQPPKEMEAIRVQVDVLGSDKSARIFYDYQRLREGKMFALYDSVDGRHFSTTAVVSGQSFREQKPFEVDDKGGSIAEPPVPEVDSSAASL